MKMNKTTSTVTASVAIVLLANIAVPTGADHFGEPDREATYVGFTHTDHGLNEHWIPACESLFGDGDCPTPLSDGFFSASCDHESHFDVGPHQGVGGVIFCGVPEDANIGVAVHDSLVDLVTARVACLVHTGDVDGQYQPMGAIVGSGTFDLQADCPYTPAIHHNDPPDTSRVAVFIYGPPTGLGATMGEVTLNFLE